MIFTLPVTVEILPVTVIGCDEETVGISFSYLRSLKMEELMRQTAGEDSKSPVSPKRTNPLYPAIYEDEIICLPELRSLAFHGVPDGQDKDNLRPIVWRILLGLLPEDRRSWNVHLNASRNRYNDLRDEILETIDRCPENCTSERIQEYDQDRNLLNDIKKDVARTQAGLHFFALDGEANKWMCNILLVHAKINPHLSYIQGMNEILAPLVYVFGTDCSTEWSEHAEADAFVCFSTLMQALKLLFEKPTPDSTKTGIHTQMLRLSRLLYQHDAELWQHLNSLGVSTDYYSLRWYTTLVAREFHMPETVRIWDSLFADANRFVFLHYVCCALVVSQRDALFELNFEGCLRQLQSPSAPNVEELLDNALYMRAMDRKADQKNKQQRVTAGYRPIPINNAQ